MKKKSLEIAQSKLDSVIFPMKFALINYALLGGGAKELIGLPAGTTADNVARKICELKELGERDEGVKNLAADDSDRSATIEVWYQADYLSNWDADANQSPPRSFDEEWLITTGGADNNS